MPQKQHNVRLAASRLNNTIVRPGELFSFNKALGPTTLDNGYQIAFGIMSAGGRDHKTVPSVAGGICQVATTLFQPVFWSGYQIEERHWHLYWIPNYSSKGVVGLDATVDGEVGLDLQFVNNSNSYLLIQSRTDASSVTFELYGTKPQWQVKVDGPKCDRPEAGRSRRLSSSVSPHFQRASATRSSRRARASLPRSCGR